MSLDGFTAAWGSPANRPEPDHLVRLAQELLGHLATRARRLALVLTVSAAVLLTLTGALAVRLFAEGGGEDWALAPLLAPAWLAFGLVLRRFLRHRRAHPATDGPLVALVRAAESENRMARSRVRTIAILHLVSLPALALGVSNLTATGRVRPHELASLVAVLGGLVVVSLIGLFLYDWHELTPRERHLRALVASYGESG